VFAGNNVAVGVRTHQLYFNGNLTAFSSEKKFRPYLSGGWGWNFFNPTDEGIQEANPFLGGPLGQEFGSGSVGGWNWGGGAKMRLGSRWGLDFSVGIS
jgi:hypothetical protein